MKESKIISQQEINEEQENDEEQDSEWQQSIRKSRRWSYLIFVLAIIFFLIYSYDKAQLKLFVYLSIISLITAILFFLPITNYIFDNEEYEPNEDIAAFIKKLRSRALLFNNLSVLVFIVTVFVIVCSFYLLIYSQTSSAADATKPDYSKLTSQIGSVIILIFLVQVLFRVFKYLLRVGAFYNGKADAIELFELNSKYDLDKLLDSFTPSNYDISDVESPNLYPKA
jgi:cell division protein FtsW (lipid II flippase)